MQTLRWLLVLAVALGVAAGAAACGGEDEGEEAAAPAATTEAAPATTEAAPAETGAETAAAAEECPIEGGVLRTFQTNDISGVIGDIGPSVERTKELWVKKINDEGGVAGCTLQVDSVDEPFPDVDGCLRNYRDAISSGKYQVILGPVNSACMAALPDLTNAAKLPLVASTAADHQPFFQNFKPYNFHATVSTFMEGRASAQFAANKGWKRIALMVPNYAYGQDVGNAFKEAFLKLVPDGEIVAEQFPEFDEDNFTPFINAMVAKKPDAIFSAFFGGFVLPFWKQWKAGGYDKDIPAMSGQIIIATFEVVKSKDDIPENTYGYSRAYWAALQDTPLGKQVVDLYSEAYGGGDHPEVNEYAFTEVGAIEFVKGIVEKTRSVDPEVWKQSVEAGDFSYNGPWNSEPTKVNPINHIADNCAGMGQVNWDESRPLGAGYDMSTFEEYCMRDVLAADEARELTDNPDVTDEAIAAYYGE